MSIVTCIHTVVIWLVFGMVANTSRLTFILCIPGMLIEGSLLGVIAEFIGRKTQARSATETPKEID
jgi:hypothetical protein